MKTIGKTLSIGRLIYGSFKAVSIIFSTLKKGLFKRNDKYSEERDTMQVMSILILFKKAVNKKINVTYD